MNLDHEFKNISPLKFDTSHQFNHFSFGKPFPGKIYPLEGKEFLNSKGEFFNFKTFYQFF